MGDHTGGSYQDIAARYAAQVDQHPIHRFYARPATLALLPPLAGRRVLDIGCGSGWYAEQYLSQGAQVTAFDLDETFVAVTRERLGDRATVLRADLAAPLSFAADATFDVAVAPLVLHYLRDWLPPLREIQRVLRPGGHLVFSTHHPTMDWREHQRADYFAVDLLTEVWSGIGTVQFYRRPLTRISQDLADAGFVVERLLEPQPDEAYRAVGLDWYERLRTQPWFLFVRARKDATGAT